jgi:hypothetical protein
MKYRLIIHPQSLFRKADEKARTIIPAITEWFLHRRLQRSAGG